MTIQAFRAYLSTKQYVMPPTPLGYRDVAFDALMYDDTGWFVPGNINTGAAGTFQPQASGILLSMWQVWNQENASTSLGFGVVSKLIGGTQISGKVQDTAAIGFFGAYASTSSSVATAITKVQSGDILKVSDWVEAASSTYQPTPTYPTGAVVIDPNPAHTWWEAIFFPA